MPYVYIVRCADGSYYTGSTHDLGKRLWEHNAGLGANFTRKRRPVTLAYCEECDWVEDAFRREKQIQGWGRKKKEALIASELERLRELAECRNDSHARNFNGAGFDSPSTPLRTGAQPAGKGDADLG
ncbi:MAG: GIY-YIG nuclease family protein [Chromatiales bacterium]|nr:GIY-YIG nuclease family protein [Chromatiales bacterium]